MRERIAQAMGSLSRRQREVFVLRDVEGWTAEEVGATLDITLGHQRVLLHRARAALRQSVEELLAERV